MKWVFRCLFLIAFLASCTSNLARLYQVSFALAGEKSTHPNRRQSIALDQQDRPYFYLANKEGGLPVYEYDQTGIPQENQQFPIQKFGSTIMLDTQLLKSGYLIYKLKKMTSCSSKKF